MGLHFQKLSSTPFRCFVSRREYKKTQRNNAAAARGTRTMGIAHSLLILPDIYEHDNIPSKRVNK
jgi:tRNA U34 5-carboxymethylaminomethyl modifying enzyme MnmG/GidA